MSSDFNTLYHGDLDEVISMLDGGGCKGDLDFDDIDYLKAAVINIARRVERLELSLRVHANSTTAHKI